MSKKDQIGLVYGQCPYIHFSNGDELTFGLNSWERLCQDVLDQRDELDAELDMLRESHIPAIVAERDAALNLVDAHREVRKQTTKKCNKYRAERDELQARIDNAPHDIGCQWLGHIKHNGDPCEAPPCDCFKADGPGKEREIVSNPTEEMAVMVSELEAGNTRLSTREKRCKEERDELEAERDHWKQLWKTNYNILLEAVSKKNELQARIDRAPPPKRNKYGVPLPEWGAWYDTDGPGREGEDE